MLPSIDGRRRSSVADVVLDEAPPLEHARCGCARPPARARTSCSARRAVPCGCGRAAARGRRRRARRARPPRHRRRQSARTASGAVFASVPAPRRAAPRPRPPRRRRRFGAAPVAVGGVARRSAVRVGCRRSSASLTTARRRRSPRRARLRRARPRRVRRRRRRRSSDRGRRRRRCSPPPPRRGPWPRRPRGRLRSRACGGCGRRATRAAGDAWAPLRPRCRGRHRLFASSVQMCCRLLRPAQCSCRVRRRPRGPPWVCRRTWDPSLMTRAPPARASARRLPAAPAARRRARSIASCAIPGGRRDRRRQRSSTSAGRVPRGWVDSSRSRTGPRSSGSVTAMVRTIDRRSSMTS